MSQTQSTEGTSTFTALRIGLYILVLICIALSPFATVEPTGPGTIILAYVNPAMAVIYLFVLGLDTMMTRIFLAEKPPHIAAGLKRVIYVNILAIVFLILFWYPMFRFLLES